jgi:hypothetical protein
MKSSLRTVSLPTEFVLWNYTQPVLQTTGKWVKYKQAWWKNISIHINMVQIQKIIKLYKMIPIHKMFCFFYNNTFISFPHYKELKSFPHYEGLHNILFYNLGIKIRDFRLLLQSRWDLVDEIWGFLRYYAAHSDNSLSWILDPWR